MFEVDTLYNSFSICSSKQENENKIYDKLESKDRVPESW